MLSNLLTIAYPAANNKASNLEQYYLVRLSDLWGDEFIEEITESLQTCLYEAEETKKGEVIVCAL